MKIPVLVQKLAGDGFRAQGGSPFSLEARGATREEAVEKLRSLIHGELERGAELGFVEINPSHNPWRQIAGAYQDDPYLSEYLQAIAEYRQEVEDDPRRP
jgi:hypothetical protein